MDQTINSTRAVGLHIRVADSLFYALEKAERLSLDLYQCFLMHEITQQFFIMNEAHTRSFVRQQIALSPTRFAHASYLINLADTRRTIHPLLVHEITFAKRYAFTHLILHAGFTKGSMDKEAGIDAVARALNGAMRVERELVFVLENSAFGSLAVGSDLTDFSKILSKLDYPERIAFCIDTAHAYAYGYDIASQKGRDEFVALIDATVGLNVVCLIHLNDTYEPCGAQADRHQVTGEGLLGWDALRAFAVEPRLAHLPLLLELPIISEEKERAIVGRVRTWL